MMQNLRTILDRKALPPAIHDIVKEFDKSFGSDVRGTLTSDQFFGLTFQQKEEMTSLSTEVRNLLTACFPNSQRKSTMFPRSAHLHQRLDYRGYTFAMASSSARDSLVMFRSPENEKKTLMGSISTIFSLRSIDSGNFRDKEIYLVVNRFNRVAEGPRSSIFREFRSVLGALYSSHDPTPTLVRLDEVDGQFCRVETEYGDNIFQALPMEKVCVSLPSYLVSRLKGCIL